MGRFLTRDTWSGDANRPLSFNRWGYVEGNPVSFFDPTGKNPVTLEGLGIYFTGSWTSENQEYVIQAVRIVASKFALTLDLNRYPGYYTGHDWGYVSPNSVFMDVYGLRKDRLMQFHWGGDKCHYCRPKSCQDFKIWTNNDSGCEKTDTCSCEPAGGFCHYARKIEFASLWDNYTGTGGAPVQNLRKINNVIHELGHAFSGRLGGNPGIQVSEHSTIINRETWRMNSRDSKTYGFYEDANTSGTRTWVQTGAVDSGGSEVFADMFIGWLYNKWENSAYGTERKKFMDENMPHWIRQAMALP